MDCIPCFFKQALAAVRATTDDEDMHRRVLDSVAEIVPQLPLDVSPPEVGQQVYRIVAEVTGIADPYKEAKRESNRAALVLYPRLKQIVADSEDPLLAACKLAIAANAIDLGAQAKYESASDVVEDAFALRFGIDHYQELRECLETASHLLYLGDNAGEIVFDKLLIEEIRKIKELEIDFVVRGSPIINDATEEDAALVGIDTVAKIVSNGYDAPAMIPSLCSPEMLALYHSADVIISKGQGNYEALSEEQENIFFLLKVKCSVAAQLVGAEVGDAILKGQVVKK